jgi:2-polyprenyl-6-methoxyphenol hydroxylase-like FAD-dependent oxidoreductase
LQVNETHGVTVNHDVVIVGGGATGLMLAAELALCGAGVSVLERRPDQHLAGARAGGLHPRSIEVLDQRGVAERFLAEGRPVQPIGFAGVPLDLASFPTRYPYSLGLWQNHIERLLAEWVQALPVVLRRSAEVEAVTPGEDHVAVALADGTVLTARYVVGCDGGRSLVRKAAGIAFEGWSASTSSLIAEVHYTGEPEFGLRHDAAGVQAIGPHEDGVRARVVLTEPDTTRTEAPTLDDIRHHLIRVYGTDFGVHDPTWISRFTDATRQAASYRAGRILLAGDSAHIHSPMGGQGLNLGLQDAVNLGWKLARVVAGTAPASLLDSYHAERHPVGARALRSTMGQVAFARAEPRIEAAKAIVGELLAMDEPRRHLLGMLSGLDIRYDLGDGHPLVGHRMPDLDLESAGGGRTRVAELLHDARPVLLELGDDDGPTPAAVTRVRATTEDPWELPVIGAVEPPSAVLVRPDGYVAWAAPRGRDGLADALAAWTAQPA